MRRARELGPAFLLRASLAAACLLLFLPLTVPLLTWRVFPGDDMSGFHVPMRFVYREALRAGDSFLWTSQFDSGIYIHGEGQTGMAHPLHLLGYTVLPLTVAINVEMLAAYAFALSGVWLLLRRFGLRSEAALGGALTFAFGGFMLPHLIHLNLIVVAAHIPWIVLAADLLLTGTHAAAGFSGVALVLASQVLLGFPQVVCMTGLIVGWFAIVRVATGTRVTRILLLALALLLGLMIGGVQLLPTIDAAGDSLRSITTAEFRNAFSLHPLNLLQLVSPYALKNSVYASPLEWFPHEFSLYAGALATISVVWVVSRRRALPRPHLATAFLCLAAIGLLFALGGYGGVYPMLAQLPILSKFRAPARHILILHFALAGIVGLTLDDLLRQRHGEPGPRTWPILIPVLLSVAVTAAALTGSNWAGIGGLPSGKLWSALGGLFCALVTAWLIVRAARGRPYAVPLLVLVFAADLARWGLPYPYAFHPLPIGRIVPLTGLPPFARPGDLVHPFADPLDKNKVALWHLRTQSAYLGLVRNSVLDENARITQRLAGVTWSWTLTGWVHVEDAMPRVRLVREWRVSRNVAADVMTIDIARTALVDAGAGATEAPAGVAHLLQDRPGRLRIATEAPAPQLLVVAERYHHGWIARVDGVDTPVRQVYGDYLGCVVPTGAHTADFVFAPSSARYGFWMTVAGLGLTIAGAMRLRRPV